MNILLLVFAFLFGTIVGSFLNVLTLRYGTKQPIVSDRSRCVECERELTWYELVPVMSFVVLRGRCRTCQNPLSFQYPLVELLTGILFTLTVFTFGLTLYTVLALAMVSLLIAITVYDLRHLIIPDPWVWAFNALAFLALFLTISAGWNGVQHLTLHSGFSGFSELGWPGWEALVAGPVAAAPFVLIWLGSRGRWMGLGDGKLALGIGWLLFPLGGWSAVLSGVVIGFWIGAGVSLALVGWHKVRQMWGKAVLDASGRALTMKSAIPLGPFLVAGTLLVYFFSLSIFFL